MIKANQQGILTGRFTVPSGVPAGSKAVRFVGAGGSSGSASYVGSGEIRVETLRQVNAIVTERFDPLAQTFTLEQSRFVAGIELWFKALGTKPVQVQIREVQQGFPTQTILARSELPAAALKLNDEATLFTFSPVFLQAAQEYAIVVLSDDATHSVAIAELGKYDKHKGWVTSQPYQVGVLLSSSNASTWTPHQDRDLSFKLKAARFTQRERTVELGAIDVDQATDLMALSVVERPNAQTRVEFLFNSEDGVVAERAAEEWQAIALTQTISGKVNVAARLTGTDELSPVVFAGTQCAVGRTADQATYITRAIASKVNGNLTVSYEAHLPSKAKVLVFVQQGEEWRPVSTLQNQNLGGGWIQTDHRLTALSSSLVRVKLILQGQPNARPRIRNLRVFST
ncbi:hypothetical protein NI389_13860 [Pseudoalteromonas xiamenensis]|uniref:hypothetical protein n=1 Tax=Pseudoalteromonas xiamenensis TaxID=882626 RepID=UPI0027E3C351|nr:hypothetical protein [Pseudoalteromonas xiamenensis]WMN59286.1 hypothetical protein NI389_13860 [Pseudoalteromonas xiamenensis]